MRWFWSLNCSRPSVSSPDEKRESSFQNEGRHTSLLHFVIGSDVGIPWCKGHLSLREPLSMIVNQWGWGEVSSVLCKRRGLGKVSRHRLISEWITLKHQAGGYQWKKTHSISYNSAESWTDPSTNTRNNVRFNSDHFDTLTLLAWLLKGS